MTNIPTNVQYTLETFTEKRQTKWKFVPYFGGPLDGPHNGPAPMPWDIQVQRPPVFQNENRNIPIPRTESVKVYVICYFVEFVVDFLPILTALS